MLSTADVLLGCAVGSKGWQAARLDVPRLRKQELWLARGLESLPGVTALTVAWSIRASTTFTCCSTLCLHLSNTSTSLALLPACVLLTVQHGCKAGSSVYVCPVITALKHALVEYQFYEGLAADNHSYHWLETYHLRLISVQNPKPAGAKPVSVNVGGGNRMGAGFNRGAGGMGGGFENGMGGMADMSAMSAMGNMGMGGMAGMGGYGMGKLCLCALIQSSSKLGSRNMLKCCN